MCTTNGHFPANNSFHLLEREKKVILTVQCQIKRSFLLLHHSLRSTLAGHSEREREVCISQIIASVRIMGAAAKLFYTVWAVGSISLSSRVSVITMAIFTKKKLTRTLSLGVFPVLNVRRVIFSRTKGTHYLFDRRLKGKWSHLLTQ